MRFGVLGTAHIAATAFVPGVADTDHEVAAVASRDEDRARRFADAHGVPEHYGDYGALLEDPSLDAVYIPLPNGLHAEWTKRAADAGRHVLCEKPLARDADEAADVVAHCRDRGVTLMEAFMYRYHPRTERAAAVAADLDVRSVDAAFGFPLYDDPADVRLDPDLAGGSLMDVGCYAVSAARLFCGEPVRAYATSTDSRDCGVDTHLAGVLEFGDGVSATVRSSFDHALTQRYRVTAVDGWLEVEDAFDTAGVGETELDYAVGDRSVTETFAPADAYRAEVEHFAGCVAAGEEPRTGGREAIENMAAIDALYESAERGEAVSVTLPR